MVVLLINMAAVALTIGFLICIILLLALTAGYYYSENNSIRKAFMDFKLSQNEVVALYVEVAREKRLLAVRYNRIKWAISQSYFKGKELSEVIAWYKEYDIKEGWAVEDESQQKIVNNNIEIVSKKTKEYDGKIN